MYKGKFIAAVVPAYNEADLINKVILAMPDLVDHIVVVDDCSTDATSDVARATGDRRVVVLRHETNTGVGGAILSGHRTALSLGSDINVVMAGDAQMDPYYLPDLLDPLCEDAFGFTKANRFFSMSSFRGMPRHRIVGNVVLSFLTKVASGYWHIFDPQNGYTAICREVLERLPLERIASGYQFENDLLVHLNILRVQVCEIPVPAVYGQEVSGIKLRRVIPDIANLLVRGFWRRIFWKYVLWSFSPIALLLFVGLGLLLFGGAVGIWVIAHTLGPATASTGTALLAVAPVLVGVQMLIAALVLDIHESPDRQGLSWRRKPLAWDRGRDAEPAESPVRADGQPAELRIKQGQSHCDEHEDEQRATGRVPCAVERVQRSEHTDLVTPHHPHKRHDLGKPQQG